METETFAESMVEEKKKSSIKFSDEEVKLMLKIVTEKSPHSQPDWGGVAKKMHINTGIKRDRDTVRKKYWAVKGGRIKNSKSLSETSQHPHIQSTEPIHQQTPSFPFALKRPHHPHIKIPQPLAIEPVEKPPVVLSLKERFESVKNEVITEIDSLAKELSMELDKVDTHRAKLKTTYENRINSLKELLAK